MLLILGGAPATQPYVKASQLFSIAYFAYFLVVLFILPFFENYLLKYFNFPSSPNKIKPIRSPSSHFFIKKKRKDLGKYTKQTYSYR
jgi:hypothetical protein